MGEAVAHQMGLELVIPCARDRDAQVLTLRYNHARDPCLGGEIGRRKGLEK